jgi:hypothetical protein
MLVLALMTGYISTAKPLVPAADASFPAPKNGMIVYTEWKNSDSDIFVVNPDGSSAINVTNTPVELRLSL